MIKLKDISFKFSDLNVFNSLSVQFESNRIYSIVGPSSCGKSTLLNLIIGILKPDSGIIEVSKPNRLGYMLQDSIMLPWRTLIENVKLGQELQKNSDINLNVESYIEQFELDGFESYYPSELSGGMRQRAALIRTLLVQPNIILMDEPFSNLDYDIKLKVQNLVLNYFYKHKCTIIIVTHDIEDAIALSDEIFILSDKPAKIKKKLSINLGVDIKNPIKARLSSDFNVYFKEIWEELKYLDK